MTDGQKSVEIRIAPDDLDTLKDGKYRLCIAKKVNKTYNVVWQSRPDEDYMESNTFSWEPQYQLFVRNEFENNVSVDVHTGLVDVELGQTVPLDAHGKLGEATTGGPATGITLENGFGSVHPGLSALSIVKGKDGVEKRVITPIYVAENPMVKGNDVLTPVEAVQVWFEQDIATSTMFSEARSNVVEIDLTRTDSAVRLYKGEDWSTPKQGALAADAKTILTIVAGLTAAVITHDLATKIASMLTGVYKDIRVDVTQGASKSNVKIVYSERAGLTGTRYHETSLQLLDPSAVDQLTGFALESFESLGVGYRTLTATSAG
ncbi:hypothetical protein ACIRG5_30565 [Lentzea sp. NPDC102401]|uniref:hypothetical protein n=1 Tax=Lentzea sp. NPDC102401 TaxID=3364128 RepID=UPI00380CD7B5